MLVSSRLETISSRLLFVVDTIPVCRWPYLGSQTRQILCRGQYKVQSLLDPLHLSEDVISVLGDPVVQLEKETCPAITCVGEPGGVMIHLETDYEVQAITKG